MLIYPIVYNQNTSRTNCDIRVLCRIPETPDDLLEGMIVWPDNNPGDWYYLAVQEASNSHEFAYKGETHERWTALTSDPDWKQYE